MFTLYKNLLSIVFLAFTSMTFMACYNAHSPWNRGQNYWRDKKAHAVGYKREYEAGREEIFKYKKTLKGDDIESEGNSENILFSYENRERFFYKQDKCEDLRSEIKLWEKYLNPKISYSTRGEVILEIIKKWHKQCDKLY